VAFGQALDEIYCEEICTPRKVDFGHQDLDRGACSVFIGVF
jgi:hypothetical protein